MNVNLTPEQEMIVQEELKKGHFRTAEEVIGVALLAMREREQSSPVKEPDAAQREAVREMFEFVERNHTKLEGITVKELIHEGHRL
jgi:Arc/MetJ-type ribon-helix-helix transcriptional regulator